MQSSITPILNNKSEPTIHLSKLSNKMVKLLKKKNSTLSELNKVDNTNDIEK